MGKFYVAVVDGVIDRKIRITNRDLILAFRSGNLAGYTDDDDIIIYCVDLDDESINPVSIKSIMDKLDENDKKRVSATEKRRKKDIEKKIENLKKML